MQSLIDWCKVNNRHDLLDEWDYEKNSEITPFSVGSHSTKKVWWIGKCGHGWDARIDHRTTMHSDCPICAGKRVLAGFNDLQTAFPNIAQEWHPSKNANVMPTGVTPYSKQKVWWKCDKGHEWQATISNRTGKNKTGCPFCAGKKAVKGISDLQSRYPELSKEWHPTKNFDLRPADITVGSSKKVWWLGKCGHEWQATVCDRVSGKGCSYCSNKKLLTGFNDLQTKYPEIANEWHPSKNGDTKPTDVLYGSHKKAWWLCQKGHEWEAVVKARTSLNTGCPFCSGRMVISGVNDLQSKFPDISLEWNNEKNAGMKPEYVAFGSQKIVWWKCLNGHEWKASIANRTGKMKSGCPYCSNRKIIPGFNDLASSNPQLAGEWNFEKNKGLVDGHGIDISTPDKVSPVSGKSVWWKCQKGHEWKAKIANRVNGDCCPLCSKAGTSISEQGVAFYLEQICRIEQRCKIVGKEIDVYLPDYKIGIEYDGRYYHKPENIHKEKEKDNCLLEMGIRVIRIKESQSNQLEENLIYFKVGHMNDDYEWALKQLCHMLVAYTGNERFDAIDINVSRDLLKIRERTGLYVKKNNISVLYPEVAKEWNYEKNGILTPDLFSYGSDIKVWWICNKGHEWKTSISHRTSRGDGCPYCSGKRK